MIVDTKWPWYPPLAAALLSSPGGGQDNFAAMDARQSHVSMGQSVL